MNTQNINTECNKKTLYHLKNLEQEALDNLVIDMCIKNSDINTTDDPDEQEHIILNVESVASNINNNGFEAQISYLIESDYLID
jgi:hypothetical protein